MFQGYFFQFRATGLRQFCPSAPSEKTKWEVWYRNDYHPTQSFKNGQIYYETSQWHRIRTRVNLEAVESELGMQDTAVQCKYKLDTQIEYNLEIYTADSRKCEAISNTLSKLQFRLLQKQLKPDSI